MGRRAQDGAEAVYSRAERISDAAVHIMGVTAALMAVPVLVTLAVLWYGDRGTVLASLVYGTSLIAMLGCSAAYNMSYGSEWTGVFRRMDHTAIYIKIAGTYTPFAVLTGAHAGYLLTGLWGTAAVGAALKIFAPHRFRLVTIALCLGMGWVGIFVAEELVANLSEPAFRLMLVGGVLYTGGVAFYLWDGLPFHITIWHAFVLAATAVFYAAVLIQLHHGPVPLAGVADDAMSVLQPATFAD